MQTIGGVQFLVLAFVARQTEREIKAYMYDLFAERRIGQGSTEARHFYTAARLLVSQGYLTSHRAGRVQELRLTPSGRSIIAELRGQLNFDFISGVA